MAETILRVRNLYKHFVVDRPGIKEPVIIHAVKDVSFDIKSGESVGLIGESGSGKTTVANLVLKLLEANSGKIELFSKDITGLNEREMRKMRKDIQIIFQQSVDVLDPQMTIGEIIREPLVIHHIVPYDKIDIEVDRLLKLVGLAPKEKHKFIGQLSGGQRQRIIIARAISTRPRLIVCDEPVSALDVSVQGQILNLMLELKNKLNLTYLFISHDLKVVRFICDRIAVMYNGEIVESGSTKQVLDSPEHDYTKMLLEAVL